MTERFARKHTPGPWHRNIPPATKYVVVWSGRNTHVAKITDDSRVSPNEAEANINLIAAAPELLEVLSEIIADGVHCDVVPHLHRKALAAIAKATGDASHGASLVWLSQGNGLVTGSTSDVDQRIPVPAAGTQEVGMTPTSPESPDNLRRDASEAEQVCHQTYAALGTMLVQLAEQGHPQAEKLMDNLSEARLVHKDVLPFADVPGVPGTSEEQQG